MRNDEEKPQNSFASLRKLKHRFNKSINLATGEFREKKFFFEKKNCKIIRFRGPPFIFPTHQPLFIRIDFMAEQHIATCELNSAKSDNNWKLLDFFPSAFFLRCFLTDLDLIIFFSLLHFSFQKILFLSIVRLIMTEMK